VSVFRGTDLALIQSFFAFSANFTGGVFVAAGDINGDGCADIVAGAGAGGGPQVTVMDGKHGVALGAFYAFNPLGSEMLALRPGVRVGVTYQNGRAAILAAPGVGVSSLVEMYGDRIPDLLDTFFAFDPAFQGGAFVGG
jgi:hypothetical protein